MKMYAQATTDGTAMSETALCENHLASHRDHMTLHHDIDGDVTVELDTTFHDCTGNDELSCNVCGATNETPNLVGKTIQRAEYGQRADDYTDEVSTTLHFTDGTSHTFVHPGDND